MSEAYAPLISVVMCVYNPGAFLEPALDSIFSQTYENWELIISDDGSNDGSRERLRLLESDPRVRLFFQEANLGYVANKNFAHRQARGEFITQLDNDDTCSPDRLEKQLEPIRQHRELKIVACGFRRIDAEGRVYSTTAPETEVLIRSREGREYPFWFPALLVHRSVFDAVGWFDTYFSGTMGDDLHWTVRANRLFPIWCLREPLYQYRDNPHSITNVLDNSRKLIMPAVLGELLRQTEQEGADWLTLGQHDAVKRFEQQLLDDKRFMATQYRIWAARAIDKRNFAQAGGLLRRSLRLRIPDGATLRTILYYLRTKYGRRGAGGGA